MKNTRQSPKTPKHEIHRKHSRTNHTFQNLLTSMNYQKDILKKKTYFSRLRRFFDVYSILQFREKIVFSWCFLVFHRFQICSLLLVVSMFVSLSQAQVSSNLWEANPLFSKWISRSTPYPTRVVECQVPNAKTCRHLIGQVVGFFVLFKNMFALLL